MKILFVTSNRIGDAVLSTGLLGHLYDQYPNADFTIACGPAAAGLFKAFPRLERLHIMRKKKRAGHWMELWASVVGTRWDIVVDLRASGLCWMLWAGKRYRSSSDEAMDHKVLHAARVMNLASMPPSPRVWCSADDDAFAKELVADDGPLLVLGPTANWGGKQWPGDRFSKIATRLLETARLKNAGIAVLGGPGEETGAAACIDGLNGIKVHNLVGQASLGQAAAILKLARLYIGNDSGLMHMAAAAGAPTLGLFGPSRVEHYAPWGSHAAWIRTPESLEEIVSAPGYDFRSHDSRMLSLTEETVFNAATELLARTDAS